MTTLRNKSTEFVSEAERAQIRRMLDKGIAPSPAQAAALLDEIDRLQGRRAAAEPEAKACPGFMQASGETYVTRTPCALSGGHGGPCRFEPEAKDEPCANAECPVGCPESHCFTRCPTCETSTVGPDGCCTVCDWGCANEVRP